MKMWKIFGLTLALTTVAAAAFASVPQSALRIGAFPSMPKARSFVPSTVCRPK